MAVRLVSYNIRFGGGRRRDAIAAVLRGLDPDVVVLQEASDPLVVASLAEQTGLRHVVGERGRSVALLARLPVRSAEWHASRPGRSALDVRLDASAGGAGEPPARTDSGGGLRLVGLHLSAGLSMRGERLRLIEIASLLRVLGSGHASDAVLVGDFNAIAPGDAPLVRRLPLWLRMLLRVDGGIRTDAMAQLFSAGWVDGYRHLQPDQAGFTLPPTEPSVRLDYVLVPTALTARLRACRPVESTEVHGLVARASDHLPLLAELDA